MCWFRLNQIVCFTAATHTKNTQSVSLKRRNTPAKTSSHAPGRIKEKLNRKHGFRYFLLVGLRSGQVSVAGVTRFLENRRKPSGIYYCKY